MQYETDTLFDAPYWLLDIVPSQIPQSRAADYAAREKDYRQPKKLEALYSLFAELLAVVSKRYAAVLTVFPEDKQTETPSGRQIAEAIRTHSRRGAVQLLLPKERSLLVLDAEDLYMTVYQPQPALLSLLRTEAEKRNLFLWRHPD